MGFLKLRSYGVATSLLPSTTCTKLVWARLRTASCNTLRASLHLSEGLWLVLQALWRLAEGQIVVLVGLTAAQPQSGA